MEVNYLLRKCLYSSISSRQSPAVKPSSGCESCHLLHEDLSGCNRFLAPNFVRLQSPYLPCVNFQKWRQHNLNHAESFKQPELAVINGAQKPPLLYVCLLPFPLFSQGWKPGGLDVIHDVFFFCTVSTCAGFCFDNDFVIFSFCNVFYKYSLPLSTKTGLFLPSFGSVHPAAEKIQPQFL